MTSPLIERVARALATAHGDAWDDVPDDKAQWTERRGEFGKRFRGVDENFKDDYRDEARAAIEAMREPSEEMMSAGSIDLGSFDQAGYPLKFSMPATVWRAMIDAALKGEG